MSSDRLTDSLDRAWTLGAPIGRGTWGRARTIRADDGREAVLKEPLTEADLPADSAKPAEIAERCRVTAEEQARLLQEGTLTFLPRIEATVDLGGGRTGLVMPRYTTLAHRMATGMPLSEVIGVARQITGSLHASGRTHGALKPHNVLFGEGGELFLADLATAATQESRVRLAELSGARAWLPPEAADGVEPSPGWDTWALAQMLYAATRGPGPGGELRPADAGLDKVALAAVRDDTVAKLDVEASNPRFRGRVADRLGTLLSRALSDQTEPSPPYRFARPADLAERCTEVHALVNPTVDDVGRLLMPGTGDSHTFQGGDAVEFSVTVACSQGVTDHEDLVCGVQIVDLDAEDDGRISVEDARFDVQVHPSGRLRYKLGLPDLEPGRYRIRVAFAIKDGGQEPRAATADIEVRPPAGYVPPPRDPPPAEPLPFPGSAAEDAPEPGDRPPAPAASEEPLTDPGISEEEEPGEVVKGAFPRPVAPPVADSEPEPLYEHPEEVEGSDDLPVEPTPLPVPDPTPEEPPAPMPVAPPSTPTAAVPPPALHPLPEIPQEEGDGLDTEELLADTDVVDRLAADPLMDAFSAAPPDAQDDLLGHEPSRSSLPEPLARLADAIRHDTYVAFGAAVAASLVLILAVSLVLRAC